MKRALTSIIIACFLQSSCIAATPTPIAEPITVQYTAATDPWLANVYDCAGANVVAAEQRAADFLDPQSVDLAIRIGQPEPLTSPAYQIDTEELLVIVHRQNPISHLNNEEVRGLFTGSIETWEKINSSTAAVQVWVFSSGEDVQQIFEQTALDGSPIASTARLATEMEEMAQAIANDLNAVGILPRHWKMGNVSDVFTVATVPVLALTPTRPRMEVQQLLACLQK